jgi:ankyrin repeat protein
MTGNTAVVDQHIRAGTDLNAKEDFGGSTPLILAAIFGQKEVATTLIDAGANLDAKNNEGGTALHQACFFCRPEIVELLLNAGADSNLVNSRGLTPLDVVSISFDDGLNDAYRYVYDFLGLKLDQQFVRQTRLQIANILRDFESENVKVDSK